MRPCFVDGVGYSHMRHGNLITNIIELQNYVFGTFPLIVIVLCYNSFYKRAIFNIVQGVCLNDEGLEEKIHIVNFTGRILRDEVSVLF